MNRIKEIRRQKNISQEELSKKTGICRSMIVKYENGIVEPPWDRLNAIATSLSVNVESLLISSSSTPQFIQRVGRINRHFPYYEEKVIYQANGICELCRRNAPFNDRNGFPYLEAHTIDRIAYGGEESVKNIVALCPNCHAKLHVCEDIEDIDFLKNVASKHDF